MFHQKIRICTNTFCSYCNYKFFNSLSNSSSRLKSPPRRIRFSAQLRECIRNERNQLNLVQTLNVTSLSRELVGCPTLQRELSNSAWLTFLGCLDFPPSERSLLSSVFFRNSSSSSPGGGLASLGLNAPKSSKLSLANRSCSIRYGTADSFKLPIT